MPREAYQASGKHGPRHEAKQPAGAHDGQVTENISLGAANGRGRVRRVLVVRQHHGNAQCVDCACDEAQDEAQLLVCISRTIRSDQSSCVVDGHWA